MKRLRNRYQSQLKNILHPTKEVVDIINDFRKEEKDQEIIQIPLINNNHIDICGTEEGKAMHNYFHYLDAKIKKIVY